jgi:8-oxo-dGTP pyrophosphatase MutT (NUDIX family)
MPDTSDHTTINQDHKTSRSLFSKFRLAVAKPVHRLRRGMTLGARVAVIDEKGRFLLVKHTYSPGWIFPGGGVERGETCEFSALREIEEEAAVFAKAPLQLVGIFSNDRLFRGDHLAFYTLRDFERRTFRPTAEIADAMFFDPADLPVKVNEGSRRRIDELLTGKTPSTEW